MANLTPKQEEFVREYLVDLNGKQAAIRAGYSPVSAEVTASKLLRVPKVAEAIAQARGERAARVQVSQDDVLRELMAIAFADPAKAFAPDGSLLPVARMPAEARAALAGIDVEEGDDTRVTRKVKSWPKVAALELLGKHLGMFTDKIQHSGPDGKALSVVIDLGAGKPKEGT